MEYCPFNYFGLNVVILYGKLLNSQSLPTSTSDLGDDRPLAEARCDFPGGNNQSEGRRWNGGINKCVKCDY